MKSSFCQFLGFLVFNLLWSKTFFNLFLCTVNPANIMCHCIHTMEIGLADTFFCNVYRNSNQNVVQGNGDYKKSKYECPIMSPHNPKFKTFIGMFINSVWCIINYIAVGREGSLGKGFGSRFLPRNGCCGSNKPS